MTHHPPVAVVTGANRGLGRGTSRELARRGFHVLLTARDRAAGQTATQTLAAEGLAVSFHPLDVTDPAAITALADHVSTTFGRLDLLVNNAGIFPDPPPGSPASSVLKADRSVIERAFVTNTLGPLALCQALIPLMGRSGRVVNVSSGMGQLSDMNGCCTGYRLSKTALNAVTRILADELRDTGIKVNSVCPGWVRTDMGGPEATRTLEEGVAGIVWAATLPDDGPSGGFFRDGQPIPW